LPIYRFYLCKLCGYASRPFGGLHRILEGDEAKRDIESHLQEVHGRKTYYFDTDVVSICFADEEFLQRYLELRERLEG